MSNCSTTHKIFTSKLSAFQPSLSNKIAAGGTAVSVGNGDTVFGDGGSDDGASSDGGTAVGGNGGGNVGGK